MNLKQHSNCKGNEGGMALFMVIAAMTVLSLLVTEFTYVAQVNQRMAFDGLDQLQAHYLAKTGYKISLLRLKGYQEVKALIDTMGGGAGKDGSNPAADLIPKQILEKIWSFPFMYPIPTSLPGITGSQKEQIEKFQKNSGLQGSFTALITSESSKYNLNTILAHFAPTPSASPSPTVSPTPQSSVPGGAPPTGAPSPTPSFNPEVARESLSKFVGQMIDSKFQSDPDFAKEYSDFRLEDFIDNLVSWADHTYEPRHSARDMPPRKNAPFYSISELHMIPPIDDTLFDLIAPSLTASSTPGINLNTLTEDTLKALVPGSTPEEIKDFFKYRDSEEEDHLFKNEDEFFTYLQKNFSIFATSEEKVKEFREKLRASGIRLVIDETTFRITVRSQVNQATKTLEALVTLTSSAASKAAKSAGAGTEPNSQASPNPSASAKPSTESAAKENTTKAASLRVTFMRIY